MQAAKSVFGVTQINMWTLFRSEYRTCSAHLVFAVDC